MTESKGSSRAVTVVVTVLVTFGVTFGAAAVGARFMPGDWYAQLTRPPLVPPNWIFGPVWSALYTLMAIAAVIVMRSGRDRQKIRTAMAAYGVQLLLNAAWSWLFFGEHAIGWALVDIILLWWAIALTIYTFQKVRPVAGLLLVPYLLWVGFASYLNLGFWYLNG